MFTTEYLEPQMPTGHVIQLFGRVVSPAEKTRIPL